MAAKGRPKRRAAKTHFFKYQLAANPTRAEENDLKRALQESLEEQHNHLSKTNVKSARNHRVNNNSTGSSSANSNSNNHHHNHHNNNNSSNVHQIHNSNSRKNNTNNKTNANNSLKPKPKQAGRKRLRAETQSQYPNQSLSNGNYSKKGSACSEDINDSKIVNSSRSSIITINNSSSSSTNNSDVNRSNNFSSSGNESTNSNSYYPKRSNDCSLSQDRTIDLSSNQFKASLTSTPLLTASDVKSIDVSSSNSSGIGACSNANTSASLNGVASGSSNNDNNVIIVNNKKTSTPSSVKVAKKRSPPGSWSLLGAPEEKVIYLRDDDPPKRLICYPAIKHIEGDVIKVRDSVLLRSGARKTDLPYIAKVCAFWEDAETGSVMMGLFWYYRPEHTEEGRKPHHLPDEIFASRHRDVDSVECIEDKCYVLTFNEYCRYRKRCKMEQVNTTWSLADVTIPVANESYPRRNRIPDSDVNPELVFCCRQIYDAKMKRLAKNPFINPKYGYI